MRWHCLLRAGSFIFRKDQIMPIGTVKFLNTDRGYGFITNEAGGPDAFVHITAVERAGLGTLREGQKLSYERQDLGRRPRGRFLKHGEMTRRDCAQSQSDMAHVACFSQHGRRERRRVSTACAEPLPDTIGSLSADGAIVDPLSQLLLAHRKSDRRRDDPCADGLRTPPENFGEALKKAVKARLATKRSC
jgi:CspA family cold shock protein